MKLKEINSNTAVHCKTEEEAKKYLSYLSDRGYKWGGGEKLCDITEYDYYENHTCYRKLDDEKRVCRSNEEYYRENGYEVVEFSDLIIHEEEISALEVLKIYGELCDNNSQKCAYCPLYEPNTESGYSLCAVDVIADNAEESIKICQKWKADHEKKEPEVEFKYQVVIWNRDDIDPIDKRIYFETQDEADEKMKELVKMYPDAEFISQRVFRVKGKQDE